MKNGQKIINFEIDKFISCLLQKTTKGKEDISLGIKTRLLNKTDIEQKEIYEHLNEQNSVFKKQHGTIGEFIFIVSDKYYLYIKFNEFKKIISVDTRLK